MSSSVEVRIFEVIFPEGDETLQSRIIRVRVNVWIDLQHALAGRLRRIDGSKSRKTQKALVAVVDFNHSSRPRYGPGVNARAISTLLGEVEVNEDGDQKKQAGRGGWNVPSVSWSSLQLARHCPHTR